MESLVPDLVRHGYTILVAVIFLEAIGLPAPAALALLAAGAVAASGALDPWIAVGAAFGAMMLADILMYLAGRYTGWWMLGLMCRLSLNPESCILRSADSFYRRGSTLLVMAKYLPGIRTMAAPMAGSMNMRLGRFLRLDLAGTAIFILPWFGVGYIFSGALEAIMRGYHVFGQAVGWVVLTAIVGYIGYHVWIWQKSRGRKPVPVVRPAEAAEGLSAGSAVIYDVRSHGYYDARSVRIRGSRRLEPNALHQVEVDAPTAKAVYLYCTCVRAATSSRVARTLMEQGVSCAVIDGGLRAWRKAGLPMEPVPSSEIVPLPVFEGA